MTKPTKKQVFNFVRTKKIVYTGLIRLGRKLKPEEIELLNFATSIEFDCLTGEIQVKGAIENLDFEPQVQAPFTIRYSKTEDILVAHKQGCYLNEYIACFKPWFNWITKLLNPTSLHYEFADHQLKFNAAFSLNKAKKTVIIGKSKSLIEDYNDTDIDDEDEEELESNSALGEQQLMDFQNMKFDYSLNDLIPSKEEQDETPKPAPLIDQEEDHEEEMARSTIIEFNGVARLGRKLTKRQAKIFKAAFEYFDETASQDICEKYGKDPDIDLQFTVSTDIPFELCQENDEEDLFISRHKEIENQFATIAGCISWFHWLNRHYKPTSLCFEFIDYETKKIGALALKDTKLIVGESKLLINPNGEDTFIQFSSVPIDYQESQLLFGQESESTPPLKKHEILTQIPHIVEGKQEKAEPQQQQQETKKETIQVPSKRKIVFDTNQDEEEEKEEKAIRQLNRKPLHIKPAATKQNKIVRGEEEELPQRKQFSTKPGTTKQKKILEEEDEEEEESDGGDFRNAKKLEKRRKIKSSSSSSSETILTKKQVKELESGSALIFKKTPVKKTAPGGKFFVIKKKPQALLHYTYS
jgi:hypothetical protein